MHGMNRRQFLQRGLFGGAVLALGAGTLAAYPSRIVHHPRERLLVLDEARFAVLAAIAARVVTVEGADPVAIAHSVDRSLARAVPEAQADIRNVLGLFENALAGFAFDLRFRPFTRLSPEAQDRVLESWRSSRLVVRRSAYRALRNLTASAYYRTEEAWAKVGYPGPPDFLLQYAPPEDVVPVDTHDAAEEAR